MRKSQILGSVALLVLLVSAQVSPAQSATGLPPLGTLLNGQFDSVNYANLNDHFSIPVLTKSGRGLAFSYVLGYDSRTYTPVTTNGVKQWMPVNDWGWSPQTATATGFIHYNAVQGTCTNQTIYNQYTFDYYSDRKGTRHNFSGLVVVDQSCASGVSSASGTAIDNSGYKLAVTATPSATLTAKSGAVVSAPLLTGTGPGSIVDNNGNEITTDGTNFTDTLGTTALSVSGANPVMMTYTNPQGTQSTAEIHYSSYTVQTNFGCSGVGEYGPQSGNLVSSISLPDGSAYSFTYEATPGYSSSVTARIKSITLPSGGQISFTYTGSNNGIECSDGSAAGITRTTSDGTWTYTRSGSSPSWTTTIIDPKGNQSIYNFEQIYETQRQIYQGTSTLLETVNTCYNGAASPCTTTSVTLPITQQVVTKSLPNSSGAVSQIKYLYDAYGNKTEEDDYDFGSGAPGALLRKILISYAALGNGIVSSPSQITIQDGSGSTKAQTTYGYDQTAVVATSGTPQHVSITGSRGNLTTVTRLVQGSTTVSKTTTYFDTGLSQTVNDLKGNAANYTYGACGNSFVTAVSEPLSLSTSATWNCNGAVQSSATDENGKTTTYTYNDPNFWRLTQTSYPDGGQISYTYNTSSTPWSVTTSTKIDATHTKTAETIYDGLQRVSEQELTSDPEGTTYVNLTYDGDGLAASTSNAYRSTSDPTYGITQNSYDGMGRNSVTTLQDGNTRTTSYTQNCSTRTDESGNQRELCYDGLGRLSAVFEPTSTGQLTVETDYAYDALGNKLSITQKGGSTNSSLWRTSAFTYDGLSRLLTKKTPETGTVAMTYPTPTNYCSGNPSQVCTEVNARGTTITYSYDALNRLTSKTYSDTTAAAHYYYDQTSYNGLTITNGKGRRTGMSDGSGTTAWSFDTMGRLAAEIRTDAVGTAVTKSFSFTYNVDGSLATLTYPSGRQITYGYSNAQRPISVQDTANAINYALSATYWPTGQLHTVLKGNDHGNAGTTLTQAFNNRLQFGSIVASNSSQTVVNLSYNYVDANGHNNGSLQKETDNITSANTQSFTYDNLIRVAGVATSTWGDGYGYDFWANLLQMNVTAGTAESLNVTVNANNQVQGFTYDADGSLLNNGSHTFTYDAENRMLTGGTATYTYDGDSLRVRKYDSQTSSNDRLYWRGSGVPVLAESDLSGNEQKEFVYINGSVIAYYNNAASHAYYSYQDRIGSIRAITDTTGTSTQWTASYYPWGAIAGGNQATIDNRYRWAGQEFDPELQTYRFPYRTYSPLNARFLSVDPQESDARVPQLVNRYSYVGNNSPNQLDPLGLYDDFDEGGDPDSPFISPFLGDDDPIPTNTSSMTITVSDDGQMTITDTINTPLPNDPGNTSSSTQQAQSNTASSNECDTNPGICGPVGPSAYSPPEDPVPPPPLPKPPKVPKDWPGKGPGSGDNGNDGGDDDCEQEWAEARAICQELIAKNASGRLRGSRRGRPYTDVEDCAKGFVSESCGGNPIDWGNLIK